MWITSLCRDVKDFTRLLMLLNHAVQSVVFRYLIHNDLFKLEKSSSALIIAVHVKVFEVRWIKNPEVFCHHEIPL